MDVNLVKKLSKEGADTISDRYLGSYRSDGEAIAHMSPPDMLRYMMQKPIIDYRDEYFEALKIRAYNDTPGKLTGIDCPVCKNKGRILDISDEGDEVFRECTCMTKRNVIRYAKQSGLGDLTSKRFKTYEPLEDWQKRFLETAIAYTKGVIAGDRGWFAMFGQSGCGKTHLCSAICNRLLGAGKQVVYMLWTSEIRKIKANAKDEYASRVDRFRRAEVLYIDDLFKGKISEADIQIAYELINWRYNSNLITIVSSELSLFDLIKVDAATAGRIKERSGKNVLSVAPDTKKNWRLRDVQEL
nr:MAG TPA: replicative helicase [Caudoviricetes sp.]